MTLKTLSIGCSAATALPNLLPAQGLYALTTEIEFAQLKLQCQALFASGLVQVLQLRRKQVSSAALKTEALRLKILCDQYQVALVVNDSPELARFLGCGVHLGQSDTSVTQARALLGEQALIGSTCHGSADLAVKAKQQGASYVAFGALRASKTKPEAKVLPKKIDQLLQATDLPSAVIGGVAPKDAALLTQGVHWVCASSSVFHKDDSVFEAQLEAWNKALKLGALSSAVNLLNSQALNSNS